MRWLEGHNSTRRERDQTLHWPWHDQHEILLQLKLDGKLTRWQCDVLIMGIIWSYSRIIFSLREQWWRRPTAAEPTMLQKWRWDNFHFLFQINLYFDFHFVHNNIAKVTVGQLSLSISNQFVFWLSVCSQQYRKSDSKTTAFTFTLCLDCRRALAFFFVCFVCWLLLVLRSLRPLAALPYCTSGPNKFGSLLPVV